MITIELCDFPERLDCQRTFRRIFHIAFGLRARCLVFVPVAVFHRHEEKQRCLVAGNSWPLQWRTDGSNDRKKSVILPMGWQNVCVCVLDHAILGVPILSMDLTLFNALIYWLTDWSDCLLVWDFDSTGFEIVSILCVCPCILSRFRFSKPWSSLAW